MSEVAKVYATAGCGGTSVPLNRDRTNNTETRNYPGTSLGDLVYDNNSKSRISSFKILNDSKIRCYNGNTFDGSNSTYTNTNNNDYSTCFNLSSSNNDYYKSLKICPKSKPECFENKSSVPSYDSTSNYIFALLLVVGFFYICKIK